MRVAFAESDFRVRLLPFVQGDPDPNRLVQKFAHPTLAKMYIAQRVTNFCTVEIETSLYDCWSMTNCITEAKRLFQPTFLPMLIA